MVPVEWCRYTRKEMCNNSNDILYSFVRFQLKSNKNVEGNCIGSQFYLQSIEIPTGGMLTGEKKNRETRGKKNKILVVFFL